MHIVDQEKCDFLREHIEVTERIFFKKEFFWTKHVWKENFLYQISPEKINTKTKKFILKELATAKLFEDFLNVKYPAQNRFGNILLFPFAVKSFVCTPLCFCVEIYLLVSNTQHQTEDQDTYFSVKKQIAIIRFWVVSENVFLPKLLG